MVSLEANAYQAARAAAEAEGLSPSAWFLRAAGLAGLAKAEEQRKDGLRAVAEFQAEFGPIPEDEKRRTEELLDRWGIGPNCE